MNMAANMLGLANAATPFGLKAMQELDKLNENKGTATNEMAQFLAINTSNLALLPTGIIGLRASLDSVAAASIILPTIVATSVSTCVAIVVSKTLCGMKRFRIEPRAEEIEAKAESEGTPQTQEEITTPDLPEQDCKRPLAGKRLWLLSITVALMTLVLGYAVLESVYGTPTVMVGIKTALGGLPSHGEGWKSSLRSIAAQWPLPLLIAMISFVGLSRRVKIYDCVVEGGKAGFDIALRIIPYLVAILVAVGMLRASGAIELLARSLEPLTSLIGMPAEALPMALMRSLSGSGAYGIAAEIMKTHGPDSLVGQIVSTMQGSTETTFYVLALYFGVVQVKRTRHTLIACLCADAAGLFAAVWAVHVFT